MVRLIKEEEPSKPSTKLSGSGSLPCVATQRSLEPAQQAVGAGYKGVANLKKDTDLDLLRSRDDFKKLVAELEDVKKREETRP
jgi:hypothetical protein